MAVSITLLATVVSLHLIAFVLAVGAERRRSTAKVGPDEYDDQNYCKYDSDASTVYGLSAFGLLLISQTVVNGVTKCFCFGKGLTTGTSITAWTVFFFIFSWVSFLGAEACLLAGSAKNAYHTKYRGVFGVDHISCSTLHKGVFAAGAALSLLSMIGSILYYWTHCKADTGGWEKHQNEGLVMTSPNDTENQQQQIPDKKLVGLPNSTQRQQMARAWKQVANWEGGGQGSSNSSFEGPGNILIVLWLAVVCICFISAVILSCAEGASRNKDNQTDTYAAGCGAGCGGGCGG